MTKIDHKERIRQSLSETLRVLDEIRADTEMVDTVSQIAGLCVEAIRSGHKILLAGNGGSAADAQHLAAELMSRFAFDRPGLPAFALTTDSSVMTAVGNDYGFERLFARQIEAAGNRGDLFIAISTSGGSGNILAAIDTARERGLKVIGLTGARGGDMAALCDAAVRVPSEETARIQEAHITLGHIICGLVEQELFGEK